jgi:NAD(P)-dependent dehydrogenase (short-subunit alcohol dehydrogenase family)
MISSMEQAFSLKGKTAIVTGGNRGIGLGISEALAQQGANVIIMCRSSDQAEQVVAEFRTKYEGKFAHYKTDTSDFESCKSSVAQAIQDFGEINILVNNAGITGTGAIFDMDESLTLFHDVINVDLYGPFQMSYIVGKHMRETGHGGKIINVSSNSGSIVNKPQKMTAYCVAKAALNQFTRCAAYEWAEYGINVNAIAPGFTYATHTKSMSQERFDTLMAKMPVGRFGQPIEIGALAVYLASEASDMVTGAIYTIDGGYSLAV